MFLKQFQVHSEIEQKIESPVVTWGSLVWLMLFCHSWKLNSNQQFFFLEMIFQNHSLCAGVLLALALAWQFWSCIFLFKNILFFLIRHSKDFFLFFFFLVFLGSLPILSDYLGIGCSGWCSQVHLVLFKHVVKIFRKFFLKYCLSVVSIPLVGFLFQDLLLAVCWGFFAFHHYFFFLLNSF